MAIENNILPSTQFNIITVPSGKSYAITTIMVCNFGASAANFDLHMVKDNDTRGDKNVIVKNLVLPPEETFTFDTEKIVLESGDYVSFDASPDAGSGNTTLSATISYLEV